MFAIKHKSLCFLFILLFCFIFLPFSPNHALADSPTIVTNDIETDTTWTLENSPYVVEKDIYVLSSATLTVDPGVIVKFNHPLLVINIFGSINVNGSSVSPVIFTLSGDAVDGFYESYRIYINDLKGKSTFSYTNFEYRGSILLEGNPAFFADNLNFLGLGEGISAMQSTATLSNIKNSRLFIYDNSYFTVGNFNSDGLGSAIRLYNQSSLTLKDSSISNTYGWAIDAYYKCALTLVNVSISNTFGQESVNILSESTLNATNLNIDESSETALAIFDSSTAVLNNSILTNNNGYFGAVDVFHNSSLSATGSIFYDGLANGFNVGGSSALILSDSVVKNFLGAGILSMGSQNENPDIISIKNSTIAENNVGIDIYSDSRTIAPTEVDISGNYIYGNFSFGAQIYGEIPNPLLFVNNWWGDKTGPYNEVSNPDGLGDPVSDFVSFTPFCKNESCTTRNPVIIVPGVLGTEISKPIAGGLEKLWLDLAHNLTDIGDDFMDALQLYNDLNPVYTSLVVGDVVRKATIDVILGDATFLDYSDGLIKEFEKQGYIEGEDLFLFPYDWRFGVSEDNINKLKQKITDVLALSGESKVDIIAHSTGGLLVKKYVVDNPLENHIDKAVFVGVPNTGAPKAVKNFLVGDNFGNLLLADSQMKKLSRNFPVAYDLSPSEQYFNTKGSYIKIIPKPLFASTPKDLNFEESNSFLIDDYDLNSQALENANNLHTEAFDNYDLRTAGVDLYAIDGCMAGTIGKVVEFRPDPVFNDPASPLFEPNPVSTYQLEYTPGDGTVPLKSATNLPINELNKFYALQGKHGSMLSQEGTRQQIVNMISGSTLSTLDSKGVGIITQDISKCSLEGRAISVFSPLSISIVDQDGNHAGLASDGVSIENHIPNAEFNIMGEHKFVYLPTDAGQTYTISVAGTGTGTFTITDASISQNLITQTQVFSNISVTPSLLGSISLSTTTTLTLDTNGDGITDQTLEPNSVLDATQSQNFVPEPPASSNSPVQSNNASVVSRGGGGRPAVSQNNSSSSTQTPEVAPVFSPIVVVEAPIENKIVKQESPVRTKRALASTTKTEDTAPAPAPEQIENLVPESTLTAKVADSGMPIGGKVALVTLAGAAVALFLGKKFIRV